MFDHMCEISFLAGAENRVRVLDAVVETPRNRYELENRLGVSRATTVRILTGLEDRGWVTPTEAQWERAARGGLEGKRTTQEQPQAVQGVESVDD